MEWYINENWWMKKKTRASARHGISRFRSSILFSFLRQTKRWSDLGMFTRYKEQTYLSLSLFPTKTRSLMNANFSSCLGLSIDHFGFESATGRLSRGRRQSGEQRRRRVLSQWDGRLQSTKRNNERHTIDGRCQFHWWWFESVGESSH